MTQPTNMVSKTWFCLFSLVLGGLGGHWWYVMRQPKQKPQTAMWLKLAPYLALFPLSMFWGWVEVLRYGLMSDEQFNSTINPHADPNTPQSNGWVVILMVLAFALLAVTCFALLALFNQLLMTQTLG